MFKVRATVWNPQDVSKAAGIELLVDTGSTYTVLPTNMLSNLGIKSVRKVNLRLANERVLEKPLGEMGIEVSGVRATATPVVFGEEDVYLLGSVTMEQLGLTPDPIQKRLKPAEALLMVALTKFNLKRF
ncbi:MAG: aspartyl protease family protein [Candidatus Aenigmatarchaeota archaeon]